MKRKNFARIIAEIFADVWSGLVVFTVVSYQEWRCERARKYLLRHDRDYRNQHVGEEIVRRRAILYRKGVSPMDASIPDRFTMERELPPMAWPNKSSTFL